MVREMRWRCREGRERRKGEREREKKNERGNEREWEKKGN